MVRYVGQFIASSCKLTVYPSRQEFAGILLFNIQAIISCINNNQLLLIRPKLHITNFLNQSSRNTLAVENAVGRLYDTRFAILLRQCIL